MIDRLISRVNSSSFYDNYYNMHGFFLGIKFVKKKDFVIEWKMSLVANLVIYIEMEILQKFIVEMMIDNYMKNCRFEEMVSSLLDFLFIFLYTYL